MSSFVWMLVLQADMGEMDYPLMWSIDLQNVNASSFTLHCLAYFDGDCVTAW
jgi:hypothetical protein